MEPRRCVAPLDRDGDRLCGELATTERDVGAGICFLVCPLCAEHAAEIDSETETNQPKGTN